METKTEAKARQEARIDKMQRIQKILEDAGEVELAAWQARCIESQKSIDRAYFRR